MTSQIPHPGCPSLTTPSLEGKFTCVTGIFLGALIGHFATTWYQNKAKPLTEWLAHVRYLRLLTATSAVLFFIASILYSECDEYFWLAHMIYGAHLLVLGLALCRLMLNVLKTALVSATLKTYNLVIVRFFTISCVVLFRTVQIGWNFVESFILGRKDWSPSFWKYLESVDFFTWTCLWIGTMGASVTITIAIRRHIKATYIGDLSCNRTKFDATFRKLYILMFGYSLVYAIVCVDFVRYLA
eukprot:933889_1